MAKTQGKKGGGKKNAIRRRAARDVKFAQKGARRELKGQIRGINNTYEGFQNMLAPMAGQYDTQTAGIGDRLNSQLAELSSLLGGTGGAMPPEVQAMLPASEANAGAQLATAYGSGAHELLANQSARNASYVQSAQREGGVAQTNAVNNVREQIMGMLEDRPGLILQRIDELRQQALERKLAMSQLKSDKAFNQVLSEMIQGQLAGNHGGGSNGGGTTTKPKNNPHNSDHTPVWQTGGGV